jgi:hypothetical protein
MNGTKVLSFGGVESFPCEMQFAIDAMIEERTTGCAGMITLQRDER